MGSAGPALLARWDDWRGGEYGRIGGDAAAANQFTGLNVLVAKGGGIFKRPGYFRVGRTSTDGGAAWDGYHVMAIGYNRENSKLWTMRAGDYSNPSPTITISQTDFRIGTGAAYTQIGDAIAKPDSGQRVDYVDDGADKTYVTVYGDQTYVLDHSAPNYDHCWTSGTSPGGRAITIFGERVVVGNILDGVNSYPNRLKFSEPDEPQNFTNAENFLDIGRPGDSIAALDTIRDTLIVCMDDGDIYTVSGALGVYEVVRRYTPLGFTGANITSNTIATTQRGLMWRLRRRPTPNNDYDPDDDEHHPQSFDGSTLRDTDTLVGWYTSTNDAGVVCAGEMLDDVLMAMGNGEFIYLRDGVWTKHKVNWNNTSGNVFATRAPRSIAIGFERSSTNSRYIGLALGLDDPNHDQDETSFTGTFTTARKYAKDGQMVTPRHVLVEFDSFINPNARSLSVTLNYHSIYEGTGGDKTSATQTATFSAPATNGQRYAKRFSFESAYPCQSFSVTCVIDGIRVEAISVFGQTDPARLH